MKNLSSFICGIIFGIALSLSGMTDPMVVLGFLDLFGHWNPSLIFVMATAVPTTFIGYRCITKRVLTKRGHPIYSTAFYLPQKKHIDKKLILGAALFGAGWGLSGLCPGPAIASLSSLQPKVFIFVLFMIFGMLAANDKSTVSSHQHPKVR